MSWWCASCSLLLKSVKSAFHGGYSTMMLAAPESVLQDSIVPRLKMSWRHAHFFSEFSRDDVLFQNSWMQAFPQKRFSMNFRDMMGSPSKRFSMNFLDTVGHKNKRFSMNYFDTIGRPHKRFSMNFMDVLGDSPRR